eukprot:gene27722-33486_t
MDLSTLGFAQNLQSIFESLRVKEDRLCMLYEDELSTLHRHANNLQRSIVQLKYKFHLQKRAFDKLEQAVGEAKQKGSKLKRSREEDDVVAEDPVSSKLSINLSTHDQRVKFARPLVANQASSSSASASSSSRSKSRQEVNSTTGRIQSSIYGNKPVADSRATSNAGPVDAILIDDSDPELTMPADKENSAEYENNNVNEGKKEASNDFYQDDYSDHGYDYAMEMPAPPTATSSNVRTTSIFAQSTNNTSKSTPKTTASASARQGKCIEVVRNRSERAALPGHTCAECEAFYNAMVQQGIVTEENKKMFLQSCSRHKARWTPPSTPEGYWDLSLHTPADWRK